MRRLIALLIIASLPAFCFAQSTQPAPASDTRTALTRKLPDLKLNGATLADTIDFIRDVTALNIHVNWKALELLNVTRQTPITLQLHDVSANVVLRTLVSELGQGNITYYTEDGVVEITTTEIADAKMFTRVYPVEDLVMDIPNFVGPTFGLQQTAQISGGGGGGGGGGSSLFNGSTTTNNDTPLTKQQRGQQLVKLVTDTVHPEIWRENGGQASIRYFNGHLIVTAPRSVHEALGGKF